MGDNHAHWNAPLIMAGDMVDEKSTIKVGQQTFLPNLESSSEGQTYRNS
jgi:hypothetical protein